MLVQTDSSEEATTGDKLNSFIAIPNVKRSRMRLHTYTGESIYPFWNLSFGQLVTNILAEMIAVLSNQMVCVTIVIHRVALHELSDLIWVQDRGAHEY